MISKEQMHKPSIYIKFVHSKCIYKKIFQFGVVDEMQQQQQKQTMQIKNKLNVHLMLRTFEYNCV